MQRVLPAEFTRASPGLSAFRRSGSLKAPRPFSSLVLHQRGQCLSGLKVNSIPVEVEGKGSNSGEKFDPKQQMLLRKISQMRSKSPDRGPRRARSPERTMKQVTADSMSAALKHAATVSTDASPSTSQHASHGSVEWSSTLETQPKVSTSGSMQGQQLPRSQHHDMDDDERQQLLERSMSSSSASSSSSSASSSSSSSSSSPMPAMQQSKVAGIPQPILIISLISATLTMASCVFNTLLPIYMVTELKMSMRSMGMFEGLLEAFSYVIRMFSGVVSDMMTSRKSAITLGFAMGAMAKFGMTYAGSVAHLFASKAVDRLANGVQAAPRDALISDLAPDASRGACFGFAQSMRKWGSAVGAVLVFFLMRASGNDYKLIFTLAASVSLCSCIAFVMLVPSHARPNHAEAKPAAAAGEVTAASGTQEKEGFQLDRFWKDVKSMGSDFYRMLVVVSMYGMGHIGESMLEARAMEVGFGKAESTLVVAALAFVIFVCAYPLGRLDDKYGPQTTFMVGMSALVLGNLVAMSAVHNPWAIFVSLLFMGIHMSVIQGPMLSIVVSLAPAHLRGTAFGIFYTVMACTAVGANSLFGSLWTSFGANAAFAASGGMTALTLLGLPWLLPKSAMQCKAQPPPPPPEPAALKLAPA